MNAFRRMALSDALDMILVAAFIYALLIWFKRTKTAFVAMGIGVMAVVYTLARLAGMYLTSWILQGFFATLIVAIIVIFQEELRSVFERIAIWSITGMPPPGASPREVEILTRSMADLARDRIGALIVVRGRDPLDRHLEAGWPLDGELSEALIKSIFDSHSLGHDGAFIIDRGRVTRFGVQLPLSKEFAKITNMGTRHTAALGLAERTDALCLVVSQERGTMSIARDGKLATVETLESLEGQIKRFLLEKAPKPAESGWGFVRHNLAEKAIAAALAIALWLFFVGAA